MIVINEEMILWHLRVNDQLAKELDIKGQVAFLRGFILKNRETGQVWAAYRFKYPDGCTNWYEIRLRPEDVPAGVDLVMHLKSGIDFVFAVASKHFGIDIEMDWFKVPEGDALAQIQWLKAHDLIEVTEKKIEVA